MSTVMKPEIKGTSECECRRSGERRVLETWGSAGSWIVRLTRYRLSDDKEVGKNALLLYGSELDELCRWWSEVKKAVRRV